MILEVLPPGVEIRVLAAGAALMLLHQPVAMLMVPCAFRGINARAAFFPLMILISPVKRAVRAALICVTKLIALPGGTDVGKFVWWKPHALKSVTAWNYTVKTGLTFIKTAAKAFVYAEAGAITAGREFAAFGVTVLVLFAGHTAAGKFRSTRGDTGSLTTVIARRACSGNWCAGVLAF